jgi:hypothetical protein
VEVIRLLPFHPRLGASADDEYNGTDGRVEYDTQLDRDGLHVAHGLVAVGDHDEFVGISDADRNGFV